MNWPPRFAHAPCPICGASGAYPDDGCGCGFIAHEAERTAAAGGDRDAAVAAARLDYLVWWQAAPRHVIHMVDPADDLPF